MDFSQAVRGGAMSRWCRGVGAVLLAFAGLVAVTVAPAAASETGDASTGAAEADHPTQEAYAIRFRGNTALGDSALRKAAADELAVFAGHGQRRADADDAAFEMELAYRAQGYRFATVDYRIETLADKPTLTFVVSEGPQVRLSGIELVGNVAFSTAELMALFAPPRNGWLGGQEPLFVEAEIQAGAAAVRDRYLGSGYLDVRVAKPEVTFSDDRTQATVTVAITEGVRYVIREVSFGGDLLPEAKPLLAAIRGELVDQPFFRRRKLALHSRIVETYGNLGYPEVAVEVVERRSPTSGDVALSATINSGPLVVVGEIAVVGNQKTRSAVIRRHLHFRPGDRYSLDARRASFRDLYRTGLFSKVDLTIEPRPAAEGALLTVHVSELPSREVFVEPGWGSYELLRLRVGARDRNVLGTGRIVGLEASGSAKALALTADLTDPNFLHTDITADLPLSFRRREEPSFTREEVGLALLLSRAITDTVTVTAGYRYQATGLTDVAVDTAAEDLDTGYNLASLQAQGTYDTRNDLFFPTHGQKTILSVEHADTWLGGDITLTRFIAGTRHFLSLGRTTVLAVRYRTGLIIPGGNEITVPLGERFFNGGENTVRSFEESELGPMDASGEPAGGLAFNVASMELRQRLFGNVAATLFVDYGNVAPNRTRSEQGLPAYESRSEILSDTFDDYFRGFRPAVGLGVQYLLPVGPARLDFAANPDADTNRGESRFVWHFSIGMAF